MSYKTPQYLYCYNYALDLIPEEINEAKSDEFSLDKQCVKFTSVEHNKNFLFVSKDFESVYTAAADNMMTQHTEIELQQEWYGVHFIEECPHVAYFWSQEKVLHLGFLGKNLKSICDACMWVDGPAIDTDEVNLASTLPVRQVPVYDPSTRAWV